MIEKFDLSNKVICLTTTTSLGNIAYQVQGSDDVYANREKLAAYLNIPVANIILTHQSHSSVIKKITNLDIGKGEKSFESGVSADGFYTSEQEIAIGIFHADCVPLFFYDEKLSNVGIIHCGFKGTMNHAAKIMVETYLNETGSTIENLIFVIGPCRRHYSFIINEESKQDITNHSLEKYIKDNEFHMPEVTYDDLLSLGARKEQIKDTGLDTVSNEKFFSAYKMMPIGRMASIIKLI